MFPALCVGNISIRFPEGNLKPLFHWATTVDNQLANRTAFSSESLKGFKSFSIAFQEFQLYIL